MLRRQSKTKTQAAYHLLMDGKWHDTRELVRHVGHAFGTANFRLRQAGYIISSRPHPTKTLEWQYRLDAPPVTMLDGPHR